jgi:hypothetical protein
MNQDQDTDRLWAGYMAAYTEQREMAAELRDFYANFNAVLEAMLDRRLLREVDVNNLVKLFDPPMARMIFTLETHISANGGFYRPLDEIQE